MAALFAENDRDLAIVARAWEAMSRSERAAETAHALRGGLFSARPHPDPVAGPAGTDAAVTRELPPA